MNESGAGRHRPEPGGPREARGPDGSVQDGPVEEAKETAAEVGRDVGHRVRRAAETRKDRTAETMSRVAHAVRRTGETLDEEDVEALGDYPDRAADRLEDAAAYVRERDFKTMLADTERFARRRPELFFGGLALAGMAAARFLRSSSRSERGGLPAPRRTSPSPAPEPARVPTPTPSRDLEAGTEPTGGPHVSP